jgi:transcriptional antiterminator RfaH
MSRLGKDIKVKILFPRYIFVSIEQQWHQINSTYGISRIMLGNEGKPVVVADKIIEDLKMREDKAGLITLPEAPKFQKGDKVKIVKGALMGYDAIFDGMKPNDRVRVLIEMLGQPVHVELDEGDLVTVVSEGEMLKT